MLALVRPSVELLTRRPDRSALIPARVLSGCPLHRAKRTTLVCNVAILLIVDQFECLDIRLVIIRIKLDELVLVVCHSCPGLHEAPGKRQCGVFSKPSGDELRRVATPGEKVLANVSTQMVDRLLTRLSLRVCGNRHYCALPASIMSVLSLLPCDEPNQNCITLVNSRVSTPNNIDNAVFKYGVCSFGIGKGTKSE